MQPHLSRITKFALGTIAALGFVGYIAFQKLTSLPSPVNPVLAGSGPTVTLMDFAVPIDFSPLPEGWWHRTFLTKPAMQLSFVEKSGVKAIRCETAGSGSIFGRFTDIDLAQFPTFTWNWLVEQPVVAAVPETEGKGDDHPARFLLELRDSTARPHHFEIIWSNGAFKAGQWKIIGDFHHYVANGGDARTGENTNMWFNEKVNLIELYQTFTGLKDTPRLTNISIFCDTDDTGTKSIAYFGKAELTR